MVLTSYVFTPKEVIQRAYCVNEEDYERTVAPLKESVVLELPTDCDMEV